MENFFPKTEGLDATIKKKPKEDPVGLFLERFDKTLDVDNMVAGEMDFSYLTPAQRAESMWAIFQNVKNAMIQIKKTGAQEEMTEDELHELKMGVSAIKNLYGEEEVKKVFIKEHRRHREESEAINGDLEKFKLLKKTIADREDSLDDYARRMFGKRGKANEMDRMLFKTAKNNLSKSRSEMKELLGSNAELRTLNQFEEIRKLSGQLKESGYMWTSSRRKFLEEFEEAALFGEPLLIFGESGTGKTELIRATSVKLTGKLCSESGGKNVRLSELIARRDISGGDAFYRFGPLGKAATGKSTTLDKERLNNGRIFLIDEFNLRDEADQIELVALIASWGPGRKIMMPVIDKEFEVASTFLTCASVNLASEKYASGRKDIPLEVMRKFGKKLEVSFMSREEIFDAMQAALMDESGRFRASKSEVTPTFEKDKEETRLIERDGQKIKQYIKKWELKGQEEKNGKTVSDNRSGGFIWRLSGVIDQLNESMARQETVLKSRGEAQYLNKVLIDIGKIVKLMENYVLSEDKISLEQFVINYIRDQFSEMKAFSQEDRDLTKEFFTYYGIDLESDAKRPLVDFEIMTPRDIGLLSPRVRYEELVREESVLIDSFYMSPEGERIEYKIQRFKRDGQELVPGEIYAMETGGEKYAEKFLGVNKKTGLPVLVPYKKETAGFRKENTALSVVKAEWKNPETQKDQAIEINVEKVLAEQKKFYKDRLSMEIDEDVIRSIWNKNYAEIKSEIEKYGYDEILIIPYNLPEEEILNQLLVETMEENVNGAKLKVAATYKSDNFKNGGSFTEVKNSYTPTYHLVLTHSIQNIEDHAILNATRNKNVMQVTGLDEDEVNRRIANGEELLVNCEIEINGRKVKIEAEGESLEEYIIQQRMYFDKTGKHLDAKNNSYARLLKSFSGSRVVLARWYPGGRRMSVDAGDPGSADGFLGFRLSCSFSN